MNKDIIIPPEEDTVTEDYPTIAESEMDREIKDNELDGFHWGSSTNAGN